jgi:anti-anti-sigma factor
MNLENLTTEKANITSENKNGALYVTLKGEVDMEDPSAVLRPYLTKMHTGIVESGIKNMTIDFQNLRFMNSSGIKEFVHWILQLNNTPAESKYHVTILYSSKETWQASSLPVLQKLHPDLIQLQAV